MRGGAGLEPGWRAAREVSYNRQMDAPTSQSGSGETPQGRMTLPLGSITRTARGGDVLNIGGFIKVEVLSVCGDRAKVRVTTPESVSVVHVEARHAIRACPQSA